MRSSLVAHVELEDVEVGEDAFVLHVSLELVHGDDAVAGLVHLLEDLLDGLEVARPVGYRLPDEGVLVVAGRLKRALDEYGRDDVHGGEDREGDAEEEDEPVHHPDWLQHNPEGGPVFAAGHGHVEAQHGAPDVAEKAHEILDLMVRWAGVHEVRRDCRTSRSSPSWTSRRTSWSL